MASSILTVKGAEVVNGDGVTVILRGAGLGGWMKFALFCRHPEEVLTFLSLENFITGYPGHESTHRAAMLKVLGPKKYELFFDRWLYYFFTEADARFFATLGLNCIRIPFNYRHFEDDMNPRILKESGFKHLDRVIDLVGRFWPLPRR